MAPLLSALPFFFAAWFSFLAALMAPFGLAPIVFWTYFLGLVVLVVGLMVAFRRDIPRARGLDKVVCLGPVLYATPLAVFAGEHFTVTREMSGMVPHWLPWHMFWVLFVGVALVAAALSLAVGRMAGLAAALLGFMFLGFVALMDVESVAAHPHNRFAWTLMLRELSFGVCALAFASTQANDRWRAAGERFATVARYAMGVVVIFYGVEHFLHPQFVPVIPLELPLPTWMPLHPVIAYGVGAAMVAAGLAMLANWYARLATTLLGLVICAVVLVVYGPILAVNFSDVGVGLNYFADTLFFGGAILMLAASMPPDHEEPARRLS
ncbi:MAG TPA: hypothetical protein VHZ25_09930 [Acidobacteriaceae bacterium]|jgi:uncharacterized membrane protein|nr:hypothetical protein [Acidobacteriaceae bacterium]